MSDTNESYCNRMVPELTVTDLPASLSFYTDVLGYSVMNRRTEPEFAYISLGERNRSTDTWQKVLCSVWSDNLRFIQ